VSEFRLPFQLPPYQDGDSFGQTMQAPPVMRLQVSASQKWYQANGDLATVAAEKILQRNMGVVTQFFRAQQHNNNIGGLPVQSTELQREDISMRYMAVQGTEILEITVYPENDNAQPAEQLVDINKDGYIAWTHNESGYPDDDGGTKPPNVSGPFDVFVNGYLVLQGMKVTRMNSIFLVMFGQTALQLHSMHDQQNPLNSPPFALYSPVTPGRPSIDEKVGVWGITIPKHDDVFLYPFVWGDGLNPNRWAYDGNNPGTPLWSGQTWDEYTALAALGPGAGNTTATPIQGIQFADPENSPLVSEGPNTITVQTSDARTAGATTYNNQYDLFLTEFFDRKSMRLVYSTPLHPPQPDQTVLTNDKPLAWGGFATNAVLDGNTTPVPGGGTGITVGASALTQKFDLTLQDQYPEASVLGEAPTKVLTYIPPTETMLDRWNTYVTQYETWVPAYDAWAAEYRTAFLAMLAAEDAYNTAFTTAGGYDSLDGIPDLASLLAASRAAQEALAIAAAAFSSGPNSTTQAAYNTALMNALAADTALWTAADAPKYTDLIPLETTFTNAQIALNAVQVTEPPAPTVPIFTSAGSMAIDGFKYRYFTVTNGAFEFGDWQGAV
jgi:hypothetical protein